MKMISCLGIPESTMVKLHKKSSFSSALKARHGSLNNQNIKNYFIDIITVGRGGGGGCMAILEKSINCTIAIKNTCITEKIFFLLKKS